MAPFIKDVDTFLDDSPWVSSFQLLQPPTEEDEDDVVAVPDDLSEYICKIMNRRHYSTVMAMAESLSCNENMTTGSSSNNNNALFPSSLVCTAKMVEVAWSGCWIQYTLYDATCVKKELCYTERIEFYPFDVTVSYEDELQFGMELFEIHCRLCQPKWSWFFRNPLVPLYMWMILLLQNPPVPSNISFRSIFDILQLRLLLLSSSSASTTDSSAPHLSLQTWIFCTVEWISHVALYLAIGVRVMGILYLLLAAACDSNKKRKACLLWKWVGAVGVLGLPALLEFQNFIEIQKEFGLKDSII